MARTKKTISPEEDLMPDSAEPEAEAVTAEEEPADPEHVESADSDDEDTPVQAKNPAANRKFLRSESVTAFVDLTEQEIEACAESMSEHAMQAAALEDEKKAYDKIMKTRIDAANNEVYRAARVYREKKEERVVSCNVVADYDAGELVWVEKEWPHREIIRRAMTEKDRQLPLPIETAPEEQEATAPDEGEESTKPCEACKWNDSTHCRDCFDNEMWEATAEPAERSCGTCAHIQQQPNEGEDDPCYDCGQDQDLHNWTPAAIPAGGETHTEAVQ